MKRTFLGFSALLLSLAIVTNAVAVVEVKLPDLGPSWLPVGSTLGAYTQYYTDSFASPATGPVTSLGTWLVDSGLTGGSEIQLQIYNSLGGNPANGPDVSSIVASTIPFTPAPFPVLTFVAQPVAFSASLIAGQVYWFGINAFGLAGPGYWQIGGHTFNPLDPGSFWYWNVAFSGSFDGQNLQPEMAFQVDINERQEIPEPAAVVVWSVLGLAFGGYSWSRSRK